MRDVGDYAQRGGILDLYPPGAPAPVRLDFFGDTLESIRSFDPETQRTVGQLRALDLVPMSEAQLTTETIRRFRQGYVAEFGAPRRGDALRDGERGPARDRPRALAAAVLRPARQRCSIMSRTRRSCSMRAPRRPRRARFAQIADYYAARKTGNEQDPATADYGR